MVKNLRNLIDYKDLYDIHKSLFMIAFDTWLDTEQVCILCPNWCDKNFGNDYILYRNAIYCKNAIDAMAFKLRWL